VFSKRQHIATLASDGKNRVELAIALDSLVAPLVVSDHVAPATVQN